MGWLVKLAFTPAGKAACALLALSAVFGAIYMKGRADGRASIADQLASDRITIFRDGRAIDHEVLAGDDDYLCRVLGGC